jgi:6-phosphogluconolactonase
MSKISHKPEIKILADAPALAEFAAGRFIKIANDAIATRGRFCVCLAGGSTPRLLYALLAQSSWTAQIEWSRVQVFWGDERCVPPDHPDSNFLMARLALLDHVPLPAENVHRIFGELETDIAALDYENEMQRVFFGQLYPRFDLVLLGLGDDGHTASLFPDSPALSETRRWVVSVEHSVPPPPLVTRISLTLPVLISAANVLFLVSGAGKSAILLRVMQNQDVSNPLPAQLVRPKDGRLVWALDKQAAGEYLKNAVKKVV